VTRSLTSRLAGYVVDAAARRAGAERPVPADLARDDEFMELSNRCDPFTMTSIERRYALYTAVGHVHRSGIAGAFVECGVWRGGSSILAALAFERLGDTNRELFLYDTFAGMTEPSEPDGSEVRARWDEQQEDGHNRWAYAGRDEVERNLREAGIDLERLHLVEGPVEETIPAAAPERIAILRLDTDWYESTRHELEHLYHRLEPGGVLLVDDYGRWQGARRAVDEFFASRPEHVYLMRIDNTGRLVLKPGTEGHG
jgi:O-methyltransferase